MLGLRLSDALVASTGPDLEPCQDLAETYLLADIEVVDVVVAVDAAAAAAVVAVAVEAAASVTRSC